MHPRAYAIFCIIDSSLLNALRVGTHRFDERLFPPKLLDSENHDQYIALRKE